MNSLDQAFVDLALDGDQDKLRHLLLAGAGVNSKNTHGKNAMVLLAERVTESLCRMKLLVDMGATIDSEVVNHAREQRALLREFVIPSGNVDVSLHTDSEEEFYERMHTALSIDIGTSYCRAAIYEDTILTILEKEYIGDFSPSKQSIPADQTHNATTPKQLVIQNFGNMVHTGQSSRDYTLNLLTEMMYLIRKKAEKQVRKHITRAVITVPTMFTVHQTMAFKCAAERAGMEVIRTGTVSSFAAITLNHTHNIKYQRCLFFHLGTGTLSVALVEIDEGIIEIKSVSGSNNLGGSDFDTKLLEYLVGDIKARYGRDFTNNRCALHLLRKECKQMKKHLGTSTLGNIDVEVDGVHYISEITRTRFEALCKDVVDECTRQVDVCLKGSGASKESIQGVLCTGGASQLPMVRQSIRSYLGGRLPLYHNTSLDIDNAVVSGAAIHGNALIGQQSDHVLLNVVSLSLGVEVQGGIMYTLIRRNTTIPAKKSVTVSTCRDNQTDVLIRIFEGEQYLTSKNCFLGILEITGIPPAPQGTPCIEVSFSIGAEPTTITVSAQIEDFSKHVCIDINSAACSTHLNPIDHAIVVKDNDGTPDNEHMECDNAIDDAENLHPIEDQTCCCSSSSDMRQDVDRARVLSRRPSFSAGQSVQYQQRDGTWIPARITRIDASLQPPAYEIQITRNGTVSYRDTEEYRLRRV